MALDDSVCEADLRIGHELGLHARPAALFVQTAQRFRCKVTVGHSQQEANAKSILGVLSLGVGKGAMVRVRAQGADAPEAIAALSKLVSDNFER